MYQAQLRQEPAKLQYGAKPKGAEEKNILANVGSEPISLRMGNIGLLVKNAPQLRVQGSSYLRPNPYSPKALVGSRETPAVPYGTQVSDYAEAYYSSNRGHLKPDKKKGKPGWKNRGNKKKKVGKNSGGKNKEGK